MQEVVSFNRTTPYRRAEGTTSGLNSAKGQRHRQVHTHGEKKKRKERSSSQTSVRTFEKILISNSTFNSVSSVRLLNNWV